MDNGKDFITRLEAADTEELAQLVAHPSVDTKRALRTQLGSQNYQRLHSLSPTPDDDPLRLLSSPIPYPFGQERKLVFWPVISSFVWRYTNCHKVVDPIYRPHQCGPISTPQEVPMTTLIVGATGNR